MGRSIREGEGGRRRDRGGGGYRLCMHGVCSTGNEWYICVCETRWDWTGLGSGHVAALRGVESLLFLIIGSGMGGFDTQSRYIAGKKQNSFLSIFMSTGIREEYILKL